jgi:hypothetical protein
VAEDFIELPRGFNCHGRVLAEINAIIRLHGQGYGRNDIARAVGCPGASVSGICAQLGLSFDRSKVRAATAARVADAKAMRAALQVRLLEEADARLDELYEPVLVFNFGGRDNTYAEQTLAQPTIEQKLKLTQAASTAITQALKLAEFDQDDGASEGRSLIGALAERLGVKGPATGQTSA